MRVFYFTVLIVCFSSPCAQCAAADDEFVDPLDMLNYDRSTKSMKRSKTVNDDPSSGHVQNDRCTIFLSRFVNVLLKNTGLTNLYRNSNEPNDPDLQSYVSVKISVQDVELLTNMANKKNIDYAQVDRILHGMFTPVIKNVFEFKTTGGYNNLETYYGQIKEVLYWILIGSISIGLLYVIYVRIRYIFNITFVLFVIFGLAFASTWYTMYMKATINRSVHLEHMPHNCHGKTGGWLTFSWFGRNKLDECKKYKEAIYLDPKYSIAATEVLAEMLSKIMVKPLETLGESIYKFNKSVLMDFPWWMQLILVPIVVLIIVKVMLLSCALLVGRSMNMKSVFGFGDTSIGASVPVNDTTVNDSITSTSFAQHTIPQTPEVPKVNFNINLFHSGQSADYGRGRAQRNTYYSFDKELKIDYKKQNNFVSMLKNETNDDVDSKDCQKLTIKRRQHRTLSV